MPAVLALLASIVWGTSDFAGGTASRTIPARTVVFATSALAFAALLIGELLIHAPLGGYMVYGVGAGVAGAVALTAFYQAMAAGPMSLVAPLSATGTVIPVLWAVLRGEPVGLIQGFGMALAFIGALLAAGPQFRSAPRVHASTLLYTLVAAAGFGFYYVFMAQGSATSVYGTLLAQRAAVVALLAAPVYFGGRSAARAARRGPDPALAATDAEGAVTAASAGPGGGGAGGGLAATLRADRRALWLLVVVAVCDVSANGMYGLAAESGRHIAVVTVLASLYPVMSSVLARVIYRERLAVIQNVGVGAALCGVLLLNA